MAEFARGFHLTMPDGTEYDGAQFPNGFVVTCVREEGLRTVAVNMDALLSGTEGARIDWAPEAEGGVRDA